MPDENTSILFQDTLPVDTGARIPANGTASANAYTGSGRLRTYAINVAAAGQTITFRDGTTDSDPIIWGPVDAATVRTITGLAVPFAVGLRVQVSGGTPGWAVEVS